MPKFRFFLVVTLAVSLGISVEGQSLREHAKRYGGDAQNSVIIEFAACTIHDLISTADVIVYGRVATLNSHLTTDETTVVTDYTIDPIRILKGDNRLNVSSKPGAIQPILIRREGGTVTEGQYRYTTIVPGYSPAAEFVTGEEVVWFLTYAPSDGLYYFTSGPFGAFRVRNTEVQAMTKSAAERRKDVPVALSTFLDDVQRRLRN